MLARTDLQGASKTNYRSALLWDLRSKKTLNEDESAALQILSNVKKPEGSKPAKAIRQKTINETDYESLLTEMSFMGESSTWTRRARVWVRAGIATGIRPIEWLNTEWENDEQTALRVKTAKVKIAEAAFLRSKDQPNQVAPNESNPATGHDLPTEEPKIRIIPVAKDDVRAIQDHLLFIQYASPADWDEEKRMDGFKKYFDGCRQALAIACRKIWKGSKTFTLYTMRSQFSANIKASKGVKVAAELMGHTSPDSPSAGYYGKGSQAHRKFKKKGGESQKEATVNAFIAKKKNIVNTGASTEHDL